MEAVNEAESSSPPSTVTTVAETVKLMAFLLSYFPSYSSSQYSRPFDLLWPKPITRDTSITESIGESTACDVCGAVHQTLGPRSPFQTFITWVRQQIFKLDLIADSFTTSLQLLKRCIYICISFHWQRALCFNVYFTLILCLNKHQFIHDTSGKAIRSWSHIVQTRAWGACLLWEGRIDDLARR